QQILQAEGVLVRHGPADYTAAMTGAAGRHVGRRVELETLRACLADTAGGQGGLVLVVGEPGIGKTRLAGEFAQVARGRGALVLWGTALEGMWQPPYAMWTEAIGEYARTVGTEQLARQLGSGGQ